MLYYLHSSLIHSLQELERTQMASEEWIQKMWYIYAMEYYSAIKNNEFIKFLGKWMELENIILSEVTVTKEHIWYVLIDKRMLAKNSLLKGASS